MMGPRQVEQGVLFYNFSLDAHVPADHLLRSIDRFVDLSELRRELAPFYSTLGRPSIDPELMIRMLIVGYCFGIRSERRLCEEVHLNLAYRASADRFKTIAGAYSDVIDIYRVHGLGGPEHGGHRACIVRARARQRIDAAADARRSN